MSVLSVRDGPSHLNLIAFLAGEQFVKQAEVPVVAYNLAGMLYLSASGWLLLSVPNAFVRGIFSAMHEPGIELPMVDGKLEAHISVMAPHDLEAVGGAEKVTERGKQFHYTLGRLKSIEPDGWPEVEKAWYCSVHSPELQELRRSYGLSSLPRDGDYNYHITVAVRRKGVLNRNDSRKGDGSVVTV